MRRTVTWMVAMGVQAAWAPIAQAAVVDQQNEPTACAAAIARLAGGTKARQLPARPSLAQLTDFAQTAFLRPPDTGHVSPQALAHYGLMTAEFSAVTKKTLLQRFEELGDIREVKPQGGYYDIIVIHGSLVDIMRKRVMALAHAIEHGAVRLDENTRVVMLDGERALSAKEIKALHDPAPYPVRQGWVMPAVVPTDERGAAELVMDQLDLPASLRAISISFAHAPKPTGAERTNTRDVVMHWAAKTHVPWQRCLVVSDNPFIERQRLTTAAVLVGAGHPNVMVDAMGPAAPLQSVPQWVAIGVLLDNFARTLFEQQQLLSARH